ncbi:hypothetical protein ACW73L_07350 [Methylolobus aquaticus]
MTKAQIEAVIGLIAGLEIAIVHLARIVAARAGLSPEQVADSFRATATSLPADFRQRDEAALALTQLADGIDGSTGGQTLADTARRTLQ